jgi:predicted oxidoreductase
MLSTARHSGKVPQYTTSRQTHHQFQIIKKVVYEYLAMSETPVTAWLLLETLNKIHV